MSKKQIEELEARVDYFANLAQKEVTKRVLLEKRVLAVIDTWVDEDDEDYPFDYMCDMAQAYHDDVLEALTKGQKKETKA